MKFPTIYVGTYDLLPLVSSSVWQTVAIGLRYKLTVTLTKRTIHIVWLLSSDLYPCSSRYSSAGRRHFMLSRFLCCTLCHSFRCSIYGSQVTEILDHFDFCTLGPQYSRVFPAVTDHNLAFRSIHAASRFMRGRHIQIYFSLLLTTFACLSAKSRWGLYHPRNLSRIVSYHLSTPALRYNFPVLQCPVQHYRKQKRW